MKKLTNTTIRDIAKRARAKPGALYDHFAPQDGLREAGVNQSMLRVTAMLSEAVEALPKTASACERRRIAIAMHICGICVHSNHVRA